jgi:hypothetical protein
MTAVFYALNAFMPLIIPIITSDFLLPNNLAAVATVATRKHGVFLSDAHIIPPAVESEAIRHPRVFSGQDIPPVKNFPYRVSVPPELREIMGRTVGYVLGFRWISHQMNHHSRQMKPICVYNLRAIP